MFSDTLLEEDQSARLDPGPPASDAQMAQMGGATPPPEPQEPPPPPVPATNAPPDAPTPTAPPPEAPAASQTAAQDLLKQVQGGQITQPAIDKAFGPPPPPQNEPGASAFAPKLGDSPGIDWKGLSDRLSRARGYDSSSKLRDNVLTNLASVLNPRAHVDSGANETAGAEDAVKLAQAQQASGIQNSQEADRKAQLERQNKADEWRQLHERMQLTQQAQQAADRLKADKDAKQMTAEEKAVADQRAEQALQETTRHNQATEGNAGKAIDERANAAALRAKAKSGGGAAMPKEGEIDKVPEDMRETVRAIGEKRAKPPDPGTKFGQKVLGYALAVYPHLDSTDFGAYKGAKDKLAKSDELVALETARNHLSRAATHIPDNFDSPTANRLRQAILTGAGADTLTPFETDVKVAADELAKAYGNNSETGRATIEHLLAPNQSKSQLRARLEEANELLTGKMGSMTHTVSRFNVPGSEKTFEDKGAEPAKQAARQYVKSVDGYGYFYDDAGKLKKEKLP